MDLIVNGLTFPEAPRWHDGRLWVADFSSHRVLRVDVSGYVDVVAALPQRPSGLGWTPDGTLREVADLSALVTGPCNEPWPRDGGQARRADRSRPGACARSGWP